MGLPPRFRNYQLRFGGMVSPAIKVLLIANTAVFLMQTLVGLAFGPEADYKLATWLGLVPLGVIPGLRIWQPFTYLFLHGSFWHLFFNMLFLWMFGVDLERAWGKRRFYRFYFLTGVGAGLINIVVKLFLANVISTPATQQVLLIPTIGASGAIYGVMTAAALVFPDRQVWLIPFPVTLPMKVYVVIMVAIEFFATLGAGGDTVSHVTHLGGILIGYLVLRRSSFFYRFRNYYSDWKGRRARRKFEVYMKDRDKQSPRPGGWVN